MAESRSIRMLALDLDGTLTDSAKRISPRTQAALWAAMARGVRVVLASGRPPAGMRPVEETLELPQRGGCLLAFNGSLGIDCRTREVLLRHVLPAEIVPELCAFAARADAALLAYGRGGILTERPADVWACREGAINHLAMIGVPDLARAVDFPAEKMLIAVEPARMAAVEAAAQAAFAGRIDVYRSCDFFLELVPRGVAKDRSLAVLLARAGLGPENLMACGDGMNDLSMLRYAGIGVAMANADAAVRAEADFVTADNDHDGVAQAVEKFILL